LADASGGGLSKRFGALSIAGLREAGIEPHALVSYLSRIGTSRPIAPVGGVAEAAAELDFSAFGRATAKFDTAELERLNALIVQTLDHAQVADRLPSVDADLWAALRANLTKVADAEDWRAAIDGPTAPMIAEDDREMLAVASETLPQEPWDRDTWGAWTAAVKAATGRKGKALFMPLRKALTGREAGPEIGPLLPRIGRIKALARLSGQEK
ncbi:MAG: glutamate--tRNA ligase, partial [Pseudomonadota bacterium]